MTKVVGVRFRQVGKIYFLHLGNIQSKQDSMLLLRLPEELNMDRLFYVKEKLKIQRLSSL